MSVAAARAWFGTEVTYQVVGLFDTTVRHRPLDFPGPAIGWMALAMIPTIIPWAVISLALLLRCKWSSLG